MVDFYFRHETTNMDNNCISTFGPACIQAKKSLAAAPTVELETGACFQQPIVIQ